MLGWISRINQHLLLNTRRTHRSLAEQVTCYEEIITEYERISSTKFSEDLKITTLVQAAPAALQVQLHMNLNEKTTYAKLREQLLAYERSTTKWQPSTSLTLPTATPSTQPTYPDTGGPMDVDRVEKGLGKKGKDKKGKGETKGKGKDKGGKAGQGAPKAKVKPKAVCWYCEKPGHYARDCRAKGKAKGAGKVQQVHAEDPPPAPTPAVPSSSASSASTSTAATVQNPRAVRRVRMITPPGVACCVVYDICEDTALFADSDAEDNDPAEDDYELAVRAVQWSGPKGAAQPGRPGRGPRPRNRERAREPDHPGHRACEKWEPGWTVILSHSGFATPKATQSLRTP